MKSLEVFVLVVIVFISAFILGGAFSGRNHMLKRASVQDVNKAGIHQRLKITLKGGKTIILYRTDGSNEFRPKGDILEQLEKDEEKKFK